MLNLYAQAYCAQNGLWELVKKKDFEGAIKLARQQLSEADESYQRCAEPGDGISMSIAAGAGSIFRIEGVIEELEKELARAKRRRSQ